MKDNGRTRMLPLFQSQENIRGEVLTLTYFLGSNVVGLSAQILIGNISYL